MSASLLLNVFPVQIKWIFTRFGVLRDVFIAGIISRRHGIPVVEWIMGEKIQGIFTHNIRVFYVVDIVRALWFLTSVWVAYELQYISLSQLTFIEAFTLGISLIMQLPTGAFADIFGKRKAMIISCLLFAVSLGVYSISYTFTMFLTYAVGFGMASAFTDGSREALLYDTLKEEHKEENFPVVSSKLSMIYQVALAVATVIGGLVGSVAYVYPIRMTAGAFFIAAIACIFYREPHVDTEKFTVAGYIAKTKSGVKELFKNSYIKKIALYYILIGSITWVCVLTFNMVLLTEMHYSTTQIGNTVAIVRILNSVVFFGLIKLGKVLTKKRTFIILPILLICSFLPGVFFTKWMAIIPVMGAMFVSTARWNLLSRYTNAEFDSRHRATAISALAMVIGIVYVAVVGTSGFIMENFGGIRTMFTLLGIITLITALPLGIHLARNHS